MHKPTSLLPEQFLIPELKKGNPAAFKELVKQFGSKVLNTSIGIVQNKEDAEDITQEVFVEVYQSINQFKGDAKLSTWIYRIAVSKSFELLRKGRTKKRVGDGAKGREGEGENYDAATLLSIADSSFYHPGIQLENKERAVILFKAIDKLPENQRTAFILHKLEDLSYAEISEVMKVSVSSIESLMFRAKQNLQKWLLDYYEKNEK